MKNDDWKIRKNSLRLQNFDYASGSHFVTIVTADRQKFFNDKRLANLTVETLLNLREKYNFNLYSYCLMPDHFHAIIGNGDSGMTLGRICGDFKSLSTRGILEILRRQIVAKTIFRPRYQKRTRFLRNAEIHPPKSRQSKVSRRLERLEIHRRTGFMKIIVGAGLVPALSRKAKKCPQSKMPNQKPDVKSNIRNHIYQSEK